MKVLNQTIALVYKDDLFTIYDGNQIRQFNSFEGMVNAITWKKKSNKLIIWCYKLSEMVLEVGEDKFDMVRKHSNRGYTVKFAKLNNVQFNNLKDFYGGIQLEEIKRLLSVKGDDPLMITYQAVEYERNNNNGKISKIPITSTGYVRRDLSDLNLINEFSKMYSSITEESHKMMTECISGGLNGIDTEYTDSELYVNCYDFKSFYPWIMYTQDFPRFAYKVVHPTSIDEANDLARRSKLWLATIKFKYLIPLGQDWLKIKKMNKYSITLTSLDYDIIRGSYKYEIESIDSIIVFKRPKPLPDKLRQFIKGKFLVKESCKKDTMEYELAKKGLNSIFGLFYQDQTKYDNDCDCWTAKERPYVIGLFTAAYGRYYLWQIMHEHNPVQWDTDGFKTRDTLDLTEYNEHRRVEDMMLGQLMCERECVPITLFANKQYMIENELRIAGTSGRLAMEYFNNIGRKPHCGDVIPPEYTSQQRLIKGKLTRVHFTIGKDFYNA